MNVCLSHRSNPSKPQMHVQFRARLVATFLLLLSTTTQSIAQWKYSKFPDPKAAVTLRLASLESNGWNGTLLVRMHPEGTVNVAVGVPATIVCSNPCKVRARVDGSDDAQRDARYPGSQVNMLFFSPQTLPFEKLRHASRLEVELETKEYGWRVLSFELRDFNIDRLNAGR